MRIRLLELLIQVRHQGFNLGLLLNPKIWTTSSDLFVFAWLKLASWAKHGLNKLFAPISPNIQTAKTITDFGPLRPERKPLCKTVWDVVSSTNLSLGK